MSAEPISAPELNAFVDGELELGRQLAIEARLANDAPLRAEVDALRDLRSAVRGRADYHVAPAGLLSRLAFGAAAPAVATTPAAPAGWRQWFAWRPMVPALGLAAAVWFGLNLTVLQAPSRDARMMQEVIASHVRSTVGQKLVDVASSDQHVVKPWLSSRLDYSPPVADAPVEGVSFIGGRVDYLDGRPVSALVYRKRQHIIDTYVWPVNAPDSAPVSMSQRGFNTIHWVRGGMRFWVVSDMNRDELGAFAQAVDKADTVR